ncbi:helix-turn-helix domain protein [[Leptolyngbya] sp. PCC 7376]|uniref:helix-turn-helix domain-containing protein n=1 Tax=[Leptolyngbya] sp. PCC 7376 TaxID=111781 RepID=UPI00029F06A2|nr:helix-turn-helix transcriptional regulator [[Leptolyngbya] sp. PCC 7376]AFY40025.1 helix-turn-helix domain protein [[Leptolyngbya] sp. PCC 7376]
MDRLKALILEKYTSVSECAKEAGMSDSVLRSYIKKRAKPSIDYFFSLADALEITTDELRELMDYSDSFAVAEKKADYKCK